MKSNYALPFAVFAIALAASMACSGPQAGIAEFSSGGVTAASGDDDDSTNSSTSSSSSSSGDLIFGTQAFTYTAPPENADDHNTGTHTGANAPPMEGKSCVVAGCHADGASPWFAAGTVYNSDGTAFTGQAEIGIVTPDNKGVALYTDKQGNFFAAGDAIPAGSHVGIRVSGGQSFKMLEPLPAGPTGGNCNATGGCHGDANNRLYASLPSH